MGRPGSAVYESAAVRRSTGSRRGKKWLCATLVEVASAVSRTKDTYLGSRYTRLASRRGAKRTAVRRRALAVDLGVLDAGS